LPLYSAGSFRVSQEAMRLEASRLPLLEMALSGLFARRDSDDHRAE
jgi:hypothetical protein